MVLICASDCEESCPGSSSSNSAFPSMEVSALFTLCFISSMYRPSVAWFSFLAAFRSACRAICKAFARDQQKRLRPIFAKWDMHQPWILGTQLPEFLGIRRYAQYYRGCRLERPQHTGDFSIAHGSHHHQVVSRRILFTPRIAIEDSNVRGLAFGLPASRQQPGKFGFIGEDDYVGVSQ